jgi:hypothetical protein
VSTTYSSTAAIIKLAVLENDPLPDDLPEEEEEEEYEPYVLPPDQKPDEAVFQPQTPLFLKDIVHQEASTDPAAMKMTESLALSIDTIWYGPNYVNYIGLKGRKMLVPIHIMKGNFDLPEYDFVVKRFNIRHPCTVKRQNIKFPDKVHFSERDATTGEIVKFSLPRDMILVDLCDSPNVPQFANITRQICDLKDIEMTVGFPALLVGKRNPSTPVASQYIATTAIVGECINGGTTKREDTAIWRGYRYATPTTEGQCGSALLTMNSCVPRKIIGFHVGGFNNHGYSQMIWRELIEHLCGPTNSADGPPVEYLKQQANTVDPKLSFYPRSDGYLILGEVNSPMAPMKTQIRPSPIFDKVSKHFSEPSPLSPRDPRVKREDGLTPLSIAIEKFGKAPPRWDFKKRVASRLHIARQFINATRDWPGPKRALTLHEAINGIPNVIEGINMRTSPGYPFNRTKPSGAIGKSYLFDWVGDHITTGQPLFMPKKELQDEIDKILKVAREENYCYNNFYLDWEKDERIEISKIADGKVRLFNIHNVAWMIVNRIYFGAAMAAYLWARLSVGSTLGMDMHGPEATELVNFWKAAGPHFFDGDVKNWDGSLDNERMEDSRHMTDLWYRDSDPSYDLAMSRVIGSSTQWRIHIIGKTMYVCFWGMPSGHLVTSFFNTSTHNQTKYMVYMEAAELAGKPEHATCLNCDANVAETKHGDDTGGGVSSDAAQFYNPDTITEIYTKHGITFTPPKKDKSGSAFMSMDQIRYLKCNFYPDHRFPHLYHMAISKRETIEELTNWIRIGQPEKDALAANLEASCKFAYAHGPDYFDEFIDRVNVELKAIGYDQLYHQWDDYDKIWLAQHGICARDETY